MFWWITASVCAFFVKGLCGFANTLIFTSILSFAADNVNISPVELLLGYPTNLILVWQERKSVDWGVCLPLAALMIAGSVPGILFLKNADSGAIKIFFGAVIIVVGLEMLTQEFRRKKAAPSKALLGVIGALSGFLCGLYGIGALLGAYMSRVTEDSGAFRANLCVVFFIESTLRVFLYALWGILTLDILKRALLLSPFMLAGLALGILASRALDETLAKKCVIVMLLVSGAALILNSL